MSNDLILAARRLAQANPKRPKQDFLRRAISTAYYAVFHTLARNCADQLIGAGRQSDPAWLQVYRSLEHGFAKNACQQSAKLGFPSDIVSFCNVFVTLQEERHRADYDPQAKYSRAQALLMISDAKQAAAALKRAPRGDRRALAVLVLLKRR